MDKREKSDRQKDVVISKRQKRNDNEEELKTQKKKDANNSNNTESNKHKLRREDNQTKKDLQNDKKSETKENEKENYRKKISLKDYKARKVNDKQTQEEDKVLGKIMKDMTNTYESMRCISPIIDNQPGTPVIGSPIIEFEPESPIMSDTEPQGENNNEPDMTETMIAVASITERTLEETVENYFNVTSDGATAMMEGNIIEQEIEDAIDFVYRERVEEERRKEETQTRKRNYKDISEDETAEVMTELDEDLKTLQKIQESKVMLNVCGVRFETSKVTLEKDPDSLFGKLFTKDSPVKPHGNTIFLDRDASHFRIILNYLRHDCQIDNVATLPRERKYLLELKTECKYYRLRGLRKIISKRLKHLEQIYGMEC